MCIMFHHQAGSKYVKMEVTRAKYPEDKANEYEPLLSSVILSQMLGEKETVAGLKQAGLEKQVFMCLERKEGTKAAV